MQKFKISRWPAYNPGGDVLRTKLIWMTSWISGLASPNTAVAIPPVSALPFLITDLFEILTSPLWAATAHARSSASFQAAVLFRRFRCTGIKIQWQSTITGTTGSGTNPIHSNNVLNSPFKFYVSAGGIDSGLIGALPINPFITPEQRWSRARDVDAPGMPKRWHSVYFSVAKLIGLAYNKTDINFSGGTDAAGASGFSAPPTDRPLLGPWLRMGIASATGVTTQLTYDPTFHTQMKFTFYTTYFDKIQNATQ